jgi:diguanylate cyclase (GGDEF)-like protein/PAS domain S-box-containing protein
MLDGFFLSDASPAQLLTGRSDAGLVVLSVLIAIVSAAVCLRLAGLAQAIKGPAQQAALLAGSLVLGSGIWAMHFVGMLAFDLCLTVNYDLHLTLLSMIPSLLASWIALRILSRPRITRFSLLTGGVCVGIGIGTMHYSGMASMQLEPLLRYDPLWFAASLVVAMVLSTLALWIRLALRDHQRAALKLSPETVKTLAALFMGAAISGTHYTAMAAARFVGTADMVEGPGGAAVHTLALTVALAALAVIALIGLLMGLLRYRALWRRVESNEQRLQSLVDMAVEGIITIDSNGIIQAYNRSAETIFGWTANEAVGRNVNMLMPSSLAEQHDGYLERFHQGGEARMLGAAGTEVPGRHKNGRHLPLKLSLRKVETPDAPLFVGFVSDLSERKKTESRLRVAASVFEHGYEGFMVLDAHFRVTDINHAYQRMSGFSKSHCVGRTLEDLYGPLVLGQTFDSVQQIVEKTTHWQGEIEAMDGNGVNAVHRISISAVPDDRKRIQHYIVVISDVTQEKSHERELEQIALYDSLTGLPNRRLLNDRLTQGMHAAMRQKTKLAVLFVDLDGFKQVNDLMGHADGDLLLCEQGRRIRAQLRGDDTAARVGGDELVLLLGDWSEVHQAEATIARLLETIAQPVALPRGTVRVTASIGMSVFPLDAQRPEALLEQADQAMYDAKQRGKNQYRRFQGPPDGELSHLGAPEWVQPVPTA